MFKEYLMYDSVSNTKRDTLKVSKYFPIVKSFLMCVFFFRKSTKNDCKERRRKHSTWPNSPVIEKTSG